MTPTRAAEGAAMSTVRAHCPFCGTIVVPTASVTLHVGEVTVWEVPCPCGHVIRHEVRGSVDERIARALTEGGAGIDVVPGEATEAHHGPPITWDDVLDSRNGWDADLAHLLDTEDRP